MYLGFILYLPRAFGSSMRIFSSAISCIVASTSWRVPLSWAPTREETCLWLKVSNGLLANILSICFA